MAVQGFSYSRECSGTDIPAFRSALVPSCSTTWRPRTLHTLEYRRPHGPSKCRVVPTALHSVTSQNNRILNINDVKTWSLARHFTKNAIANRLTYHRLNFFAKFVDLLLWSFHLIPNVHVNAVINYFSLYGTIQYQQKCLLATHKPYRRAASSGRLIEAVWRFKGPDMSRADAVYWCQHCCRIHINTYDANDNRKICNYSSISLSAIVTLNIDNSKPNG